MKFKEKFQDKAWLSQFCLRLGLGIIFFWFGIDKFWHTYLWVGFIPMWMNGLLPFSAEVFMYIQGVIETVLGLMLLSGFKVKYAGGLCALILLGIIATMGFNDIMIRDFGLLMMAVALFVGVKE
jgi:uncharacterized membrane protein YphA (DoxX/SURF4 family)